MAEESFKNLMKSYKDACELLFAKPSEDAYNFWKDKIDDEEEEFENTHGNVALLDLEGHVSDAIDYIAIQVTKNTAWTQHEPGSFYTVMLADIAESVLKKLQRNGMKEGAQQYGLKLLMACLQSGPALCHMKIMSRVYIDASLSEFWEGANAPTVKEVFDILVTINPEPRTEMFTSDYENVIISLLQDIRTETYRAVKESSANLLITSIERMSDAQNEPACKLHGSIMNAVYEKCFQSGFRLYDEFPDTNVAQDHTKRIQTVLQKDTPFKEIVGQSVAKLFHYCKVQLDHEANPGEKTVYWELLISVLQDYLFPNISNKAILELMIQDIMELLECGDEALESITNNLMRWIVDKNAAVLKTRIEPLIDRYFMGNITLFKIEFIGLSAQLYRDYPHEFQRKLDDFANRMAEEGRVLKQTLKLFLEVAKHKPSVLSEHVVGIIASRLQDGDTDDKDTARKILNNIPKDNLDPSIIAKLDLLRKETKTTTSATTTRVGPPSVFISYTWGIQPQIKALYQRLTERGFHCWMDIENMGGGHSLNEKIEKGISDCKVVLSCITTAYASSESCQREVSLADNRKKPIIPLLLEDMKWPPKGDMAPRLTKLIYINFCKPSTEIQNHWQCPEFEDLIKQIRERLDFVN